ncbi:MAG: pyridoxamine 5'-phosphate oxidase family protein [Firmicutes bacterium]|nr:pyridoxamine 5'-phosphate oxidase family protein [Bacillota bacterium]
MERKMHKIKRQMPEDAAKAAFEQGHHGTLAVNGDDGYPYAVPVNYVYMDDKIYIHSAKVGYKIECIQKDSKVCFSAILDAQVVPKMVTARFTSVIAFGKASLVEDEDERYKVLKTFVDRLCGPGALTEGMTFLKKTISHTAIIRIDVEELKGKTSGAIEMDA